MIGKLGELLKKFKDKIFVSKEEYESAFQEDIRNKNVIIDDTLRAIKAFKNQDEPTLDRSRMQNQGYNRQQQGYPGQAGVPPMSRAEYGEFQKRKREQREREEEEKKRFPTISLKEMMDSIRLGK